jgi:methylated-DNA-protein-cysteine methyltransferase-like protein
MYTIGVSRSEKYLQFYAIVSQIPEGQVATYGQVATLAGYPGQARQVGYALNSLTDDFDIPWQRVINAKGLVSARTDPIFEEIQRQILESEGILFDDKGRIDLSKFQWKPGNC